MNAFLVRPAGLAMLLIGCSLLLNCSGVKTATAQDTATDQAALATYADAANFQTNGAIDLAIEQWQRFLDKYPNNKLAAKAAHYLGVCFMQTDPPNLSKAAEAFEKATGKGDFELSEESLSNLGWCYYAVATETDDFDDSLLKKSVKTYQALIRKNPNSRYSDRAHFYSGEAAYSLGNTKDAVKHYDDLLQMESADQSPLRCEALYARGVAQEELKQFGPATKSYQQLLASCEDSDHAVDVLLRLGDMQIANNQFEDSIKSLEQILTDDLIGATDEDRAFALYRQGFAFAQSDKANEAASRYERLLNEYPQSPYASAATLAAAQTQYQVGNFDDAANRFRIVLSGDDMTAATEAAHWLARIDLNNANGFEAKSEDAKEAAQSAFDIASSQLERGAEGTYAVSLELDAAEALAMQDGRLGEALKRFEKVAQQNENPVLATRGLYNAAFTALQMGEHDTAIRWSDAFAKKHVSDPLLADTKFIGAEARLLSGSTDEAASRYRELIESPAYDGNSQRPLWILRGANAMIRSGQFEPAAVLISQHIDDIEAPDQRAEAFLIAGQAQLQAGQAAKAAESFKACREASPDWSRSEEAFLREGQAQMTVGNEEGAKGIWNEIVSSSGETAVADQARYKLGQLASQAGEYQAAIDYFQPILRDKRVATLVPFATYAMGWAQMQDGRYAPAVKTLDKVIDGFAEHSLYDDSVLARGISHRNLENLDAARSDLETFLDLEPSGTNLGHALYELALIDQNQNKPKQSVERLQRIVEEVGEYPDMDKVLYELGWSLKESGNVDGAMTQFQRLIREYPDNTMVADAAYFVGQSHYAAEQFGEAIAAYAVAADQAPTSELKEKSLYRLGWSQYKNNDFASAEQSFKRQYVEVPGGPLYLDSMMMIGESRFKQDQFETSLRAYTKAREKIQADGDDAKSIRDPAERQVRELILLHGGQSAAQLKRWEEAIVWYDELRERFPATTYLPQVFYETGYAHQQSGDEERAMKLYSQVADNYRNELAARARFMMGEIHFANKEFSKAIPEFQRVMFGFGAAQAPENIKNWQAKCGFEAGRCSELLMDQAKTNAAKAKARKYAIQFYQYVTKSHSSHELAGKASGRVSQLSNSAD